MFADVRAALPVGTPVRTKKGCRFKGPFNGKVVGYATDRGREAVMVEKVTGKIVRCLAKNLFVLGRGLKLSVS
jgi:hypothetical protein